MTNYLNLNKLTAGEPYALYRKAIWIYIFLLIFEGALRKWVLPSLATPLLLVRDPIAIWLTIVGLQKGWIKSGYAKTMMVVASISFILTLAIGHHNLFVALFGWRIYFFHFPMIFVMGKVLTRADLLKIGQFILWISIPMTILIFMQFHSPQTAWVNMGVGGEGTAGFSGAMGYMRPPGTFSFTSGYVMFQAVVGCYLLYYLLMNNTIPKEYQFSKIVLIILAGCYLLSIPTSISRTHFFQTGVFIIFLFIAAMRRNKFKSKFLKFILIAIIAGIILYLSGLGGTSMEAFMDRLEGANKAEGGAEGVIGDRYIGGLLGSLINFQIPIFGYGIGLGTNAGANIMGGNMYSFGFNGENEWSRIIGECGMLLGFVIIGIRLIFSLDIWNRAYKFLVKRNDLLPWMLSAGMMLTVPQGQWSIPTNLGFCILFGGLTLASINCKKTSKKQ
ncbi:hypothetical protein [Phocaeicola plebeius]|jgi:hypothetical protein|uniref:hypothetical protein n=1 Tax=Phocaeicola plebeius TaxID=310297 RepID=UPI00294305D4|nr:hypothetical protein [Phocaeicola plebeius]